MADRTWDLVSETLRGALPDAVALPSTSDEGPVAVAGWRRAGFGAVLVVRRWRNGALAYDVVPGRRDSDGEWESSAYGGSALAETGGIRGTVEWFADHVTEFDGDEPVMLRMLVGEAAANVCGLRVRTADGGQYEQPVHHPSGLVVIGVVGADPVLVTALDSRRRPLVTHRWTASVEDGGGLDLDQ
jgi:hypothetical protein